MPIYGYSLGGEQCVPVSHCSRGVNVHYARNGNDVCAVIRLPENISVGVVVDGSGKDPDAGAYADQLLRCILKDFINGYSDLKFSLKEKILDAILKTQKNYPTQTAAFLMAIRIPHPKLTKTSTVQYVSIGDSVLFDNNFKIRNEGSILRDTLGTKSGLVFHTRRINSLEQIPIQQITLPEGAALYVASDGILMSSMPIRVDQGLFLSLQEGGLANAYADDTTLIVM